MEDLQSIMVDSEVVEIKGGVWTITSVGFEMLSKWERDRDTTNVGYRQPW